MATFTNRLNELISSDYSTIAVQSHKDFFNAAIAEVADMLPNELLLKYAVDPINLNDGTPAWTSVEGKKVLLVVREESGSGPGRECTPVSIQDFETAKDSTSIYEATKYSPVFAYTTDAGATSLSIYPTPTATETVKVYYFAYPALSDLGVSTIDGFPDEVLSAVCFKAAANMLSTYISDFVQDEEDQEMLNMLSAQLQTLLSQFSSEMARFTEPDSTPTGE